jgi:MYXO-CTERM domain-containing protein
VDGVCCDVACAGLCQACSAVKTGGVDGICAPVPAGSDPRDDCPTDPVDTCQRDGACDGSGACRTYAAGTACGADDCVANTPTTHACDAAGTCAASPAASSCLDFLCVAGACKTSCATAADCIAGDLCVAGACQPQVGAGQPCATDDACTTGFCADGLCCDQACAGQCEACDVAGLEGTCSAVTGPPHGDRPACDQASGGDPCTAALCDGSGTTSCDAFVGADVPCRAASCAGGEATAAASCAGTGSCPPASPTACGAFQCDTAGGCLTQCSSLADCVPPSVCDATHTCVAAPDGGAPDAGGGGATGEADGGTDGTVSGASSCSCNTPGTPRGEGWLVGLALAALSAARRRRR